jgi:hypothetical protein
MLELTLGHDRFCNEWMSSYDFETIQRPSSFAEAIEYAVKDLRLDGIMSEDMVDFAMGCLVVDPADRTTAKSLVNDTWLRDHSRQDNYSDEDKCVPSISALTAPHQNAQRANNPPPRPATPRPLHSYNVDGETKTGELSEPDSPFEPLRPSNSENSMDRRSPYDQADNEESKEDRNPGRSEPRSISSGRREPNPLSANANMKLGSEHDILALARMKERIAGDGGGDARERERDEQFKDSVSLRARRHFEGTINTAAVGRSNSGDGASPMTPGGSRREMSGRREGGGRREEGGGHGKINFPPIEPGTPSINSAKKMVGTALSPRSGRGRTVSEASVMSIGTSRSDSQELRHTPPSPLLRKDTSDS